MKSRFFFGPALLFCAVAAFANPPRITFMRTMAPAHDLAPAESLAVIYAIGDSNKIEGFVERFVDLVSRAGSRIVNAVENNHHLLVDDLVAALRPPRASRGRVPRHQSLHLRGDGAEAPKEAKPSTAAIA